VANLALKDIPWMAIYCKERDITVTGIKKHEDDMKRVVECLNRKQNTPDIQPLSSCRLHASKKRLSFFGPKKESAWALKPPTNPEGFVIGEEWAIARIGLTSPVEKSQQQNLTL